MKIIAIDISGKVDKYDQALYESVIESLPVDEQLAFACPSYCIRKNLPSIPLCNLIPAKYKQSKHLWKRMLKVLEGIINYYIVGRYIRRENIDLLHLQWLPFMEICNIERYWLQWILRHKPHLKIILTIHNIYPHNFQAAKKNTYRQRMLSINRLIDHYIVHTKATAKTISNEFCIPTEKIAIIHHGIFIPNTITKKSHKNSNTRILLFGLQSQYKGTDLLIHASELLPENIRKHIQIHIVGHSDNKLYNSYRQRAEEQHIHWENRYVSDQELYQEIQDSDILVFPYKEISQSGALLLGLYFEKPVITSDLQAFTETLGELYPKQLIFKRGDAQDLANAIVWSINHISDLGSITDIIHDIIEKNSWESAAQLTRYLYHTVTKRE